MLTFADCAVAAAANAADNASCRGLNNYHLGIKVLILHPLHLRRVLIANAASPPNSRLRDRGNRFSWVLSLVAPCRIMSPVAVETFATVRFWWRL